MARFRINLRALLLPIAVSVLVHVAVVLCLPVTSGVDLGLFREEVERRFSVVDVRRVRERELIDHEYHFEVTVDPAAVAQTFADTVNIAEDNIASTLPDVTAVPHVPARESILAVPVSPAGELSQDILVAARKASHQPPPRLAPRTLRTTVPAIRFEASEEPFDIGLPAAGAVDLHVSTAASTATAPAAATPSLPSLDVEPRRLRLHETAPIVATGLRPVKLAVDSRRYENILGVTITAGEEHNLKAIPKDVIIVVDISFSMHPRKVEEARKAVAEYLTTLSTGDRFNVLLLGEAVYQAFQKPVSPTADTVPAAVEFIQKRSGESSADVIGALTQIGKSLTDRNRAALIVLVTNAHSTQPAADVRRVIGEVIPAIPAHATVLVFDSGDGGDTYLIDLIAWAGRGASLIIPNTNQAKESLLQFMRRCDTPLLSAMQVESSGVKERDDFLRIPSIFFLGLPIEIYTRVYGDGAVAFSVIGDGVDGRYVHFEHLSRIQAADNTAIERNWVRHAIHGAVKTSLEAGKRIELAQELRELAKKHGLPLPPEN